jgi:predicted permease
MLDLPFLLDLDLDYRVLLFTVVLSLATGLAFGLAPAFKATRVDPIHELHDQASGWAIGRRRFTLKHALLVAQVAASCLLLVAAGLVVRALVAAERSSLSPGFDPSRLAFVDTDPASFGREAGAAQAFYESLRERIARLPGVESATLASGPPVGGFIASRRIAVDGYETSSGEGIVVHWTWAGPGYFETLGVPLLHGRTFSRFDGPETTPVAVVNEMMARRYFGFPNAVGRRLRMIEASEGTTRSASALELEVVGVVPTLRTSVLDDAEPLFYRSFGQAPALTSTVVVRTTGAPEAALQPMLRAVRETNPGVMVTTLATLSQHVRDSLGVPRAAAGVLAGFGALGLALACVGLYAVVAFAVSRRAREIGIRLALGARRRQVVWLVSRDVAALIGVGLALGVGLSWLGLRVLAAVSEELSEAPNLDISGPTADALTFVLVALLMTAVGLAAALLPAARAARTDSISTLRHL